MKKDIEWLKSAIQQNLDFYNDKDEEWQMAKVRAYAKSLDLINQLDEPELPVIPKFVAYVIEAYKSNSSLTNLLADLAFHGGLAEFVEHEDEDEVFEWARSNRKATDEILARAWLHGYKVEEEPQYIIKTGDERYLSQLALNYVNNPPVTTVHHMKEMAIRFSDRELAHKVADLVNNGEVEELEE